MGRLPSCARPGRPGRPGAGRACHARTGDDPGVDRATPCLRHGHLARHRLTDRHTTTLGRTDEMAIWARKPESTWETCPEGLHHAVCVDVIDLGLVATKFGDKPKVRIVWQIEDRDGRGARFRASQMYTPSLSEKSALRPVV